MTEHHLEIDLVITGGLRVSSDFAKALAMGADAIAIASAALMSAACQQYRICELRSRLHIDHAAKRLSNYLNASFEELKMFGRITGHQNIHDLSVQDLVTINREISEQTDSPHA